jgi:hypothetical protein
MKPTITPLESFPANSNPFHHDLYHMGTRVGEKLIAMHENHPHEKCKYLIFCDEATGERFKLEFNRE